jgi:hypothetical protein
MVDRGITPLPGFPGESITQGLDGLAARLAEYRKPGARFAKWRAVIDVGPGVPSDDAIAANTGWKPAVQSRAEKTRRADRTTTPGASLPRGSGAPRGEGVRIRTCVRRAGDR